MNDTFVSSGTSPTSLAFRKFSHIPTNGPEDKSLSVKEIQKGARSFEYQILNGKNLWRTIIIKNNFDGCAKEVVVKDSVDNKEISYFANSFLADDPYGLRSFATIPCYVATLEKTSGVVRGARCSRVLSLVKSLPPFPEPKLT